MNDNADSILELGQAVLKQQPFSEMLGAKLTGFSRDQVELRLLMRPELLQQYGFAHGGVLAYLADNAMTFAGGAALMSPVVTAEMKLNYLRPATGSELIARAKVIGSGKTQAVTRCEVYALDDNVEKLCAAAQGTISRLSKKNEER